MSKTKPVIVIGGGVAGIQASLDLAESGVPVVMIEKTPSIGGAMAALDKTFPTLDCSICIEAPIMSDVMNNANITVKTLAEVVGIEGEAGNFKVRVREKARFVTDACTSCQDCVAVCPQVRPNVFDEGLGFRKAIYSPFDQAEPATYVIDIDSCLNNPPNYLPCQLCSDACKPKAIDFNMELSNEYELDASAVIVATGFNLLDPSLISEYGYMQHPDILTAMEFERLENAAGPTGGHIICPSNHKEPESILYVLCVGSRDQRFAHYCSRVCCMYSMKEAYMAVDHGIKHAAIMYMDIRSYGKEFDAFYHRTIAEGIEYIRGRPAKIYTDGEHPRVLYENTEKGVFEEREFDMVVLAPALLPARGSDQLAAALGIELDEDGFIATMDAEGQAVSTTKEGIYVAGVASGPKDIPDSVAQAGAAAAAAMIHVEERSWPEENFEETIPMDNEERIGVFVCDCGSNIAGVVDVPDVVNYAKTLDNVLHVEEVQFACAGSYTQRMTDVIKEKKLNRLVVASCSPKTHTPTFQRALLQAGLNKYMLEMANIRNHDSWVHKNEPELATEKAKDMVNMAVKKAELLEPLYDPVLSVTQRAVVVGGGPAGMSAAWSLGKQGFTTYLIEKSDKLGGMLHEIDRIAPTGTKAKDILDSMLEDIKEAGVKVFTNTKISSVSGVVGNFTVELTSGDTLDVGAIILAYGGSVYQPTGFEYGKNKNVITNLELEKLMETMDDKEENVTFIGCVGSRIDNKDCSRYCCTSMMQQALELKEKGKNVTVVYKDIRTYTRHAEELYYEASQKGVAFVQYPMEWNPEEKIKFENGNVITHDELLQQEVAIPTDKLVLAVGVSAPEDNSVADMLKVSLTEDNFLLELHPKLAPVEAAVQGVYMGGNARGPVMLDEAISQGLAAAAKATNLLAKDTVDKAPLTAIIDPDKCTGCHQCSMACTYGAITGEKKKKDMPKEEWVHEVIQAACAGCGNCAAACNFDAITMPNFTDEQIYAQIEAALETEPEDKVLTFTCNWCSYAGADQAGIAKYQFPTNGRIIRTMCSARVRREFVEKAFDLGAGAVLLTGCRLTDKGSDCHYNFANVETEKRYNKWKRRLARKGIAEERFQLQWISAAEGILLAETMKKMHEVVERYKKTLVTAGD